MKMFGSLINFILKFVEFISQLFKPKADQSQISVQQPPNTVVVAGDTGNPFQQQQLADTAEGHHSRTDVEENLRLSDATAGEHSNLITRSHMHAEEDAAAAAEEHRRESNNHTTTRARQPPPNNDIQLQWRLLMITICYAAVGTAVQVLQTIKDVPVHKSVQFHCSRIALALSLAYLTVSVYVHPYSDAAALIFEHLAVFFSAMAFILVITMVDFPHAVIIVSLAIFSVSLLAVFLATYLWRKLGFGYLWRKLGFGTAQL